MRKWVYNLEFPSRCHSFEIAGYRFNRADNYPESLVRLQHLGTSYSEFHIPANTGEHAVTAYVDLPEQEESAVLEWSGGSKSALSDVLLLLSIFTGREVFAVDKRVEEDGEGILLADPRVYQWGGVLVCSIPYKGEPLTSEPFMHDVGFEEGLNQVYALIRSEHWQRKYQMGYFLFLVRMAFRRQPLESAFIQCWTIWEHLFAILNGSWLSRRQMHRLSAAEKIAFLLIEYALTDEIDDPSRARIESLAEIRNRLVHFGRFPERGSVHDDAILFIRLTEFVIAKILGLLPSNVFNTVERLEDFLKSVKSG